MQVKEIMTPEVECARENDSIAQAAERMRSLDVGALPICGDNDRLLGIITDRDITIRATANHQNPDQTKVRDVMSPDVVYLFEDQDVGEVVSTMRERHVHRVVILDRDKQLKGIVSIGDLVTRADNGALTEEALEELLAPAGWAG